MNFVSAATHAPNDSANWTTSATMDAIPVHGEVPTTARQRSAQSQSSKRRKTRWNDWLLEAVLTLHCTV